MCEIDNMFLINHDCMVVNMVTKYDVHGLFDLLLSKYDISNILVILPYISLRNLHKVYRILGKHSKYNMYDDFMIDIRCKYVYNMYYFMIDYVNGH